MHQAKRHIGKHQRGVSLTGLIVLMALLGMVLVVGSKVLPSIIEYKAIKNAIATLKESGGNVREMQNDFNKNAYVTDIKAIRGTDLVFSKDSGELEISFAYEKRIELMGPVSLLIDYAGTTAADGVVKEKTAEQ